MVTVIGNIVTDHNGSGSMASTPNPLLIVVDVIIGAGNA